MSGYEEIDAIMDTPKATVISRLHRGRRQTAQMLGTRAARRWPVNDSGYSGTLEPIRSRGKVLGAKHVSGRASHAGCVGVLAATP